MSTPGETTAHVLMISTRNKPSVAVYPDSDKIGIWTGNREDDLIARRMSGVEYYDGEAAGTTASE